MLNHAQQAALVFGRLPGAFLAGSVSSLLSMGTLTPFFAGTLVTQTSWAVDRASAAFPLSLFTRVPATTDVLFGWPVHHFFVLVVLYVTFTAWCLVVVSRNIKRDPTAYELLTPREALGFTAYINIILVGFLRWSSTDALVALSALVGVNVFLFFVCGLALLRGRDYVRRLAARAAALPPGWPGLYLGAGLLATGLVIIAVLSARSAWTAPSDAGLAIVRVAMCAAWIARDLTYLQWVCLLQRSRSVLTGLLSLTVFYVAAGAFVSTQRLGVQPHGSALLGALVPGAVLFTDPTTWRDDLWSWVLAFLFQVVLIAAFAILQARTFRRFAPAADTAPAVPA